MARDGSKEELGKGLNTREEEKSMATKKKTGGAEEEEAPVVVEVEEKEITFYVLGDTPLMMNSLKGGLFDLLLPPSKDEKKSTLKHIPWLEYRLAAHVWDAPETLLCFPAVAFKHALADQGKEARGFTKAGLERNVFAVGDRAPIWGIPRLDMREVRPIGQAPDMRTRPVLDEWASVVTIRWDAGFVTEQNIIAFMKRAGYKGGIGEWRPGKSGGDYGRFSLVDSTDKRYLELKAATSREKQIDAMNNPEPYNLDTQRWLDQLAARLNNPERDNRGMKNAEQAMSMGRFEDAEPRGKKARRKAA